MPNNPTKSHKSLQLQLVVGPLWPGVVIPVRVPSMGQIDQNMSLKEKWVHIKNGYSHI